MPNEDHHDTNRRLYIDTKVQRDEQTILIEVKGLERSPVHELMELLGQYLIYSYFTANEIEQLYTVVDIAHVRGKRIIGTVLVARLRDEQIIIELDHNNKPLIDVLRARGIPDAQLVLASDTTVAV
ncbi:MAG: hypothetical protein GYB65_14240 [Chloroflexi bacterium]|nr:hypothetical protein [Chloroflexota bacterium]